MTDGSLTVVVRSLLRWYRASARDLPWRRTRDPYAIWISEIMLQQTQVQTVIPYWNRWIASFPDVGSLARASESQVLRLWAGLGYYRRARHLHAAARQLLKTHPGQFPCSFDAILALPGVGRYTAGAIASIAFNHPAPVLDGNVLRVMARYRGLRTDPRAPRAQARLWEDAQDLVSLAPSVRLPPLAQPSPAILFPLFACGDLNQALMELGAVVCTPRQPRCPRCPIATGCVAHRKALTDRIPAVRRRPTPIDLRRLVAVVRRRGRVLLTRTSRQRFNAGLWEFPTADWPSSADPVVILAELLGATPLGITHRAKVRQVITHHRITLEVVEVQLPADGSVPGRTGDRRWFTVGQIQQLPLSAAHRRIALEPVSELRGVLRRGILAAAKAARPEHPRSGL